MLGDRHDIVADAAGKGYNQDETYDPALASSSLRYRLEYDLSHYIIYPSFLFAWVIGNLIVEGNERWCNGFFYWAQIVFF